VIGFGRQLSTTDKKRREENDDHPRANCLLMRDFRDYELTEYD
jgi:hypothetical protein